MTIENDRNKIPEPLTEAEMLAAFVSPPIRHNAPIDIVPYNANWPTDYLNLASLIHDALGNVVLQLEHVGSTSVPQLSAKPIIDMVLVVEDSSAESIYVPLLEKIGFVLKIREPNWNQHRLLKPQDIDANLHVFSKGCDEISKMLRFRDWLRSHSADRKLYEETKQALAAQTWEYVQNYADAKSQVIHSILGRANRF